VLSASSEEAAHQLAETLKRTVLSLPPLARGIQINLDQNSVTLAMAVTEEQLLAGLRTNSVAAAAPVLKSEPTKPAGPQTIRIFGLDEGPREIVLR
jgi:hypothetical protein